MINTQDLRRKILDLAMRGQLTEQSESETVDCISELEPLSSPFPIPNNWRWVRIESIVAKDVGGGTPSKSISEYWDSGTIPWMSVKDFSSAKNGILEDTTDHITQAGLENSSSNLVDTDAIIICMRMSLGKIVKLKRPMAINQDLRAIWLKPFVDDDFFVFFYSTLRVEGHGMTVAGINKKQLMNYMMPLPPFAEQKRIVERIAQAFSVLDTIDDLQAQYADNLMVLKAKLIDAAIQGKLTEQLPEDGTAEELLQEIQIEKQPPAKTGKGKKDRSLESITNDEIPFEIPDNWKWCRLADISSTNIGLTYHPEDVVEDGTIVVRSSNIINSKMDYTDLVKVRCSIRENQYLNHNDIVICARNGSKALVGKCAIYEGESGVVSFGAFMAVLRTPFYKYVFYYLLTDAFRRYFHSDDSKQINQVTQNILKEAVIPLPPLAEQERIVEKLDVLMKSISA